MHDWFIETFYNSHASIGIYLEITGTLTSLTALQYHAILLRMFQNRKFVLFFESTEDRKSCFYWKNIDHEKMHTLVMNNGMIATGKELNEFIFDFIYDSLKCCHCGEFLGVVWCDGCCYFFGT
jgi:hypothetical protein